MTMNLVVFDRYDYSKGKECQLEWADAVKLFAQPKKKIAITEADVDDAETLKKVKPQLDSEKVSVGMVFWGKTNNGYKKKSDIINHTAIALDYDDVKQNKEEFLKNLNELMSKHNINYMYYSTTKNTKKSLRLRIIIPLSEAVVGDKYQAISRAMISEIGIDGIDNSTIQDNRGMGFSCLLADGEYIYNAVTDKEFLNVDNYLNSSYKNWKDVREWIDLPEEKKAKKAAAHRTDKANNGGRTIPGDEYVDAANKTGVEGAFCRTFSIEEAIKKYIPCIYVKSETANDRYTYKEASSTNGLVIFGENGGQACYSHHSTDPAGGYIQNAFNLVRIHKFGAEDGDTEYKNVKQSKSYKAMKAWAEDIPEVKRKLNHLGNPTAAVPENAMKIAREFFDTDKYPANDYGVGKMLARLYGDTSAKYRIAWAEDSKTWIYYDGEKWVECDAPKICKNFQLLTNCIKTLCNENDDKVWLEHASKCIDYCQQSYKQKQCLEHVKYLLPKEMDKMDKDVWVLNTKTGTINLKALANNEDFYHKHNADDDLTQVTGAGYHAEDSFKPNEECLKFLSDLFPDSEVYKYIQKYVGYTLSGSIQEKNLIILYATHGNNGKSAFNNLWAAAMGTYAMGGVDALLLASKQDKSGSNPNPALAACRGKRLITWDEMPAGARLDQTVIKRMTGGGDIVARKCFQDVIQFKAQFKGSIACNDIPAMADANDKAMQIRIRCVPFDAEFSEARGNLDKTIGEEKIYSQEWKDTFLHWAIEGFCLWREEGLDNFKGGIDILRSNIPERMRICMKEYFKEADDVGDLILTYLDVTEDKDDFISFDELYTLYINDNKNNYQISKKMFGLKCKKAFEVFGDGVKQDRKRIKDENGHVRNAIGWYGAKRLDWNSDVW